MKNQTSKVIAIILLPVFLASVPDYSYAAELTMDARGQVQSVVSLEQVQSQQAPAQRSAVSAFEAGPLSAVAVATPKAARPLTRAQQIASFYVNYLGRKGSEKEILNWVKTPLKLEQIKQAFLQSQERANLVASYYQGYLGRNGSAAEIKAWARQDIKVPDLKKGFLQSQERSNLVASYYQNYLGRAGSAAEIRAWALQDIKVPDLKKAFLQSQERANLVASYYKDYLGRDGNVQEIQGWALQNKRIQDIKASVLVSDERKNKIAGYFTVFVGRSATAQEVLDYAKQDKKLGEIKGELFVLGGWTRAASNANFVFAVMAGSDGSQSLKLMDLRTGEQQTLSTRGASDSAFGSIRDVSPDGATVIYQDGRPTVWVRAVDIRVTPNIAGQITIHGELAAVAYDTNGNLQFKVSERSHNGISTGVNVNVRAGTLWITSSSPIWRAGAEGRWSNVVLASSAGAQVQAEAMVNGAYFPNRIRLQFFGTAGASGGYSFNSPLNLSNAPQLPMSFQGPSQGGDIRVEFVDIHGAKASFMVPAITHFGVVHYQAWMNLLTGIDKSNIQKINFSASSNQHAAFSVWFLENGNNAAPLLPSGWTRAASNANFAFRIVETGGIPSQGWVRKDLFVMDLRTGQNQSIAHAPGSAAGYYFELSTVYDVSPDGTTVIYGDTVVHGDISQQEKVTVLRRVDDPSVSLTISGQLQSIAFEQNGQIANLGVSRNNAVETVRVNLETLQIEVPQGWTRAASNPNFAFQEEAFSTCEGYTGTPGCNSGRHLFVMDLVLGVKVLLQTYTGRDAYIKYPDVDQAGNVVYVYYSNPTQAYLSTYDWFTGERHGASIHYQYQTLSWENGLIKLTFPAFMNRADEYYDPRTAQQV